MSRIGRQPIAIPNGVNVSCVDQVVTVTGPLGTLTRKLDNHIKCEVKDGHVYLTRDNDNYKAYHGLYRQLVNNMIIGVTKGYTKKLNINGIGYKLVQQGNDISMSVGFSHPVVVKAVDGIKLTCDKTEIVVSGIDKELVGKFASNIRDIRPVEPYHGYGISYADEVVYRKEVKSGKK